MNVRLTESQKSYCKILISFLIQYTKDDHEKKKRLKYLILLNNIEHITLTKNLPL